jgi:hypothetical protein
MCYFILLALLCSCVLAQDYFPPPDTARVHKLTGIDSRLDRTFESAQRTSALCRRRSPYNPHSPFSLHFESNAGGHVAGAPRDAYSHSIVLRKVNDETAFCFCPFPFERA